MAEGPTEWGRSSRCARMRFLLLALAVVLCACAAQASAVSATVESFPAGLGSALPALAGPSLITEPAPQASTTGTHVELIVHGENLASLTAEPLPVGITEVAPISETEWKIVGMPSVVEAVTVKLKAEDLEKVGTPAEREFTWTIYAPAAIATPGPQTGSVGSPLSLALTGSDLHELMAAPLPPGLKLVPVSETEWDIVGTPTAAGTTTTTLEAENPAGTATAPADFEWTIGEASSPPAPQPPAATGSLTVSPGVVFSAAKATCGGLSWPTTTVTTQWLLDGAPIAGAISATFTPPRADDGHQLSCRQTASADGLSASLTSVARTIHEQPAGPAWPISPATQQCASAVCMQEGSAPAATGESYPQAGAWWATQQVRCASAPWTSAVGDSALPAVRAFAEAHTVTLSLQRVTATGVVTVATQQLGDLTTARDELDGSTSPFGGAIVSAFGSQVFAAHELWPGRYPGATGHSDWFAPGGGLIAYALTGSARSFQLTYSLSAADLGSKLRCLATAEDGPAGAGTVSSFTSPEYAVPAGARCGPRRLAARRVPQPAVVQIGDPRCLPAASSLPAIAAGLQGVAVKGSTLAVSLSCGLAGGCDGTLTLASSRPLATARLRLARGRSHIVRLRLSATGRSELRASGSGGLAAAMRLSTHGHTRPLVSLRLLATR
ncbi:MAG TPA: hypothetical protein VH061_08270 [Solirubrobacteraceae bacterium]|nr:hypothetical protein [Solirubrobacteraceae bacterium]